MQVLLIEFLGVYSFTELSQTKTTVCEVIIALSINIMIKLHQRSQTKLGCHRSKFCSDLCTAIKCGAYWAVIISKFQIGPMEWPIFHLILVRH